MDNAGFGGLLALGWLVLAGYVVLLLIVSLVFAVKRGFESACQQFSAWFRRAQVSAQVIEEVSE